MTEAYEVLIVDDEEIVCRGLAQFVKWEAHGFQVAGTAYSVDEALGFLERHPVDVVFLDIRMPKKTGLDMLKVMHSEYPDTKAVILSGFSEFSYAQEAVRYGAADYLTKPVNLKEVEGLLDRLREDFAKRRQDNAVKSSRVEGLLLSAARGYGEVKAEDYGIAVPKQWYGLAVRLLDRELSEQEIGEKKEWFRQMTEGVVPEAIVLNNEAYGLFAVIPCRGEEEAEYFIEILEQSVDMKREWACGVSKIKHGFGELRDAYQEAGQALRYHRASKKEGVIWYQNIEALFSQSIPEVTDLITQLYGRITGPEERSEAVPQLMEALERLEKKPLTLAQLQTLCIRCLIELNGLLQGLKLQDVDLHGQLNQTLEKILLSSDMNSVAGCVGDYVNWLIGQMGASDEQQLGKGVIREMQLYIRKHYQENLSLNALAEQFFLHPNYLSRLFKEKTGKNFVEYLTEVRMEKVMELLDGTEDKIADICAMAGYDNPRYFSKVFKQYTGMTPSEYRERNEGKG